MSPEQENQQWRKEQRVRLLAQRLAMPRDEHRAAGAAITKTLVEKLLPEIAPRTLAAYWPIRGEYDTRPVLSAMYKTGMNLALPAVEFKSAPLAFRAWKPGSLMEEGPMDIPQPARAVYVNPDCLLIALVGFDAHNHRLGYGAGLYDRTLAAMNPKPVSIGVGFAFQRLDNIRPQPHDMPLDYIVTEEGVQRRG